MELNLLSDEAVLQALGQRIARFRLNRNATQASVAHEAGVSRRTLSKLENGQGVDLQSFIRILRALDLLGRMDQLVPLAEVSPISLMKLRGRERHRARGQQNQTPEGTAEPWQWPDQTHQK